MERAEKTLTEARKVGGATFAIAAGLVVRRLAQVQLGVVFDCDEMVRLAEEADKIAPSVGTRSTLQSALLARANKDLSVHDKEYAALAKKAGRSLTNGEVVAIALWRKGKLRDQTAANADVRRTIELIQKDFTLFTEPSEWEWAMLRAGYPEVAARVAAALTKSEFGAGATRPGVAALAAERFRGLAAVLGFGGRWQVRRGPRRVETLHCRRCVPAIRVAMN